MEKVITEPPRNPFTDSATASRATSIQINSCASQRSEGPSSSGLRPLARRRLQSYRLKGEYEQPWKDDPRLYRTRCGNYIIWGCIAVGIVLSGYINYSVTRKVPKQSYCLILDDHFQTLDTNVWNHEVQVNGFGNGVFDWTTSDNQNSYVDAEGLHIVPTLTTETTKITSDQILDGFSLNLTKAHGDGSCTGTSNDECSVRSNHTLGTILPPVRSARLNTRGTKSIRYGRVEVTAKFPTGDWLWPAIWMMPVNDTYGSWPASGEIDIAESRGNDVNYPLDGRDVISSSMHWGPTAQTDSFWRATRGKALRRTDFSQGFHIFGLQWSQDYLFTYVDSPLQQVLYWTFEKDRTMWEKGVFAGMTINSSLVRDPWSSHGRPNTPFDQPFYLVLNVAVGGRNGWFRDGVGNKPWTDSGNSALDFYEALPTWYPTWPNSSSRGMTVQSVRMWQEGACP
ncbi:uncharacterized protein ATNIH1004_005331 [Aspergillus tanneri]|uniref:GH16 domain-containing protein n=1 Tax=Aspergillus tanneri TaxID=1220188 RepID=A0A5M9ML71_9EURO|nr:uncharacterized protein ATNIH1004_005331 [Aspergillus tanneri]KAA8646656.1 hypothetical protein ATNIH1004_005331 [Aspergillus tanneri]